MFEFAFMIRFRTPMIRSTDPTATNTAYLNNLTNTIGTAVDTDLGLAILSLAADFTYNNQSGSNVLSGPSVQNGVAQQNFTTTSATRILSASVPKSRSAWTPTILYGIDTTATRSSGSDAANVNTLNFGPFINGSVGPTLDFDLSGGGNLVDTKPSVPPAISSAVLRHQINAQLADDTLGFARSDIHYWYRSDRRKLIFGSQPSSIDTFHYAYRCSLL